MTPLLAPAGAAWAVLGAAAGALAGVGAPRLIHTRDRPPVWLLTAAASASTAACFGLLAAQFDGTELVAFSLLATSAVAVSLVDLLEQRIPTRVVLPVYIVVGGLLVIAATQQAASGDLARAFAASALLAGSYLLAALASRGQLGSGDVKFSALLGLAMGWQGWTTVVAGTLTAWLGAAAYLLILRLLGSSRPAVPMAPFLLVGALLALTLADPLSAP